MATCSDGLFCLIFDFDPWVGIRDSVPGSRSSGNLGPGPGLILKSGTGTETQIQNLRDVGLGPGLKF